MTRGKIHVDTNLTVLLVTGMADKDFIRQHKRLQEYDERDFDLLVSAVEGAAELCFSPNVMTETSNLSRLIREPLRSEISRQFAILVDRSSETYTTSRKAVGRREFHRLGLTDAVLLESVSRTGGTLLTADLQLYLAALRAGLPAQNFNHIRDTRPDF